MHCCKQNPHQKTPLALPCLTHAYYSTQREKNMFIQHWQHFFSPEWNISNASLSLQPLSIPWDLWKCTPCKYIGIIVVPDWNVSLAIYVKGKGELKIQLNRLILTRHIYFMFLIGIDDVEGYICQQCQPV